MKKYFAIDPRIKPKISDLMDQPVLIKVNKFNEEAVDKFSEQMSLAHQIKQPIIPIIIDSYGGSVYSLIAMISEIDNSRIPVATVVESKAMSAGSFLFCCGSPGHRYISDTGRLMIHSVSSMTGGRAEDMHADADETEQLNQLLFHRLAKNCNKDKNYFLDLLHDSGNVDYYITAKYAKKHGIADHIGTPEFKITVAVSFDFGVNKEKTKT